MGRKNTANKVTSKYTNVTEMNVLFTLHSTSTHVPTCLEARLPVHCVRQ